MVSVSSGGRLGLLIHTRVGGQGARRGETFYVFPDSVHGVLYRLLAEKGGEESGGDRIS
jgi:hypothetical protein